MKTKTQDLTGPALDWAVAMTEGYANLRFHREPPLTGAWIMDPPRKTSDPVLLSDCAYSTSWQQGGPIIEREGIRLHRSHTGDWWAGSEEDPHRPLSGETPLIAAMRCYVASRLGDEVDIPEDLL